jgi:hypothetical protein
MHRLSRFLPHLATAVLLAALAAPAARATTFVMMSDADLAHHAELIAEVVIDRSAPSEIAGSPATAYEARVETVLKGTLADERLSFKVPGGQGPDGVSLKLWGMPVFLPEGRALVFLSRNGDGSWGIQQFLLGAFHQIEVGSRRVALRDLTDAVEVQLEGQGGLKTVEQPLDLPRDWQAFTSWLADFGHGHVRQADYLLSERDPVALSSKFTFLLPGDGIPIRWFDFDSNLDITWRADSTGQIGVPGGGFVEIQQAINAWNNDPSSNIRYRYNGTRALRQPACTSPSRDGLITFDDTTGYIAGEYACDGGGILAVGGPCYDPSQLLSANGRNWRPASDAFVVTNNNLECFFNGRGNAGCNMAELMTHELGHTLGLGHSETFASTMFATFHGDNRCAALRDDDRAGIAFMYGNGSGGGGGTTVTAPTNLTANVLSNTQVALAWQDKSNNETSFRIERKTTGSFAEIANVGAGVTTYTATGLSPNTAYSFRVRARANSTNSGYSNTATATTPGTPTPPSQLRTTSTTASSVTIAWNDNSSNETGFRLERRSLASSTFQLLATLPAGTTSYTNINLSAVTRYEYRVRAESTAGASAFSNVLSTHTQGLAAPCVAGARTLCLEGGRVKVEVFFRDQANAIDRANGIPLTNQSGTFWFFNADNVELIVKAIDANGVNGNFWIFYGALSDREYEIAATNTQTGEAAVYYNPQGEICGDADTSAFPVASTAAAGFTFERLGSLAAPVDLAEPIESIEQGLCAPGAGKLCLFGNRFEVEVDWATSGGQTGDGVAVPSTDISGFFWFFAPQNLELVVKVIDGRTLNGKFWLFYGALTDVQYELRVRDTVSGASKTYTNAQGNICGRADTSAF